MQTLAEESVRHLLMNPKTKEELEEELHEKYRQLCEKNREKQSDSQGTGNDLE